MNNLPLPAEESVVRLGSVVYVKVTPIETDAVEFAPSVVCIRGPAMHCGVWGKAQASHRETAVSVCCGACDSCAVFVLCLFRLSSLYLSYSMSAQRADLSLASSRIRPARARGKNSARTTTKGPRLTAGALRERCCRTTLHISPGL